VGRTSWADGEILLASSAERVRDSLIARANQHGNASYVSEWLEAELLVRKIRLLDLTLAEFCQHAETARALFFREPDDEALRGLILSNMRLAGSALMWGFPHCLFGSEEATLAYFGQIAPHERAALFAILPETISSKDRVTPRISMTASAGTSLDGQRGSWRRPARHLPVRARTAPARHDRHGSYDGTDGVHHQPGPCCNPRSAIHAGAIAGQAPRCPARLPADCHWRDPIRHAGAGCYLPQARAICGARIDDLLGPAAWLATRDDLLSDKLAPFADPLREWLDGHGVQAVLVRPERYVFGAGDAIMLRERWAAVTTAPPARV